MSEKDTAIQNLVSLIQHNPKDINAWLGLGKLIEDPNKKVDCYRQVLKLEPENQEAQNFFKQFNIARQEKATKKDAETHKPIKKRYQNKILIWLGITVFGVLFCGLGSFLLWRLLGNTGRFNTSQISPSPTPKLYSQEASSYLEKITEMPNGFQIDYSQDKFGDLTDDSHTTQIGTVATRQFFNPLFPQNEIIGVLYFIEVYNDIEEAEASYNIRLQNNFTQPNLHTHKGDFDVGVYEIKIDNQDASIISLDKLIRKSNVVIFITCGAIIDENTDSKEIVTWALYYENLILSKIQ